MPVLSHYYARSVAYAAKHPQNINNELRNAVTHMARALAADDMVSADHEMAAASRHVERFKRDCLKVAVIYAGKDAAQMIRQIESARGRLDPRHHLECASIVADRYKILMTEVLGDDGSAERWEGLLLRIERLRGELLSQYDFLHRKKFGIPWLIAFVVRWFARLSSFLVGGVVVIFLASIIIPKQDQFGEKVQHRIIEVTDAVLHVHRHDAASTPSKSATPGGPPQRSSQSDKAHH